MARCDVPRSQCLHWHGRPHLRDPRQQERGGRKCDSYRANCPAHDDTARSLSVSTGEDQRIVWHCFAGCDPLDVRAALIRDGWSPDCLGVPKDAEQVLVDQIRGLFAKHITSTELRWRIFSLVSGFGGELPPKGRYPGGRRGFADDCGVGRAELYRRGLHR